MSLAKIEEDIRQIEALKHYPEVKRERDGLLTKVEALQGRISELEIQTVYAASRKEELKAELDSKRRQYEIELAAKDEQISTANAEKARLQATVRDLEEAEDLADGRTLSEAVEAFKVKKDNEIAEGAERLFIERKSDWERHQKPREASQKAVEMLSQVINVLDGPRPHSFPKDLIDLRLPDGISTILSNEVRRRIEINVEPKAKDLAEQMKTNALKLINRAWPIPCDQCGIRQNVEMTPERITYLLAPDPLEFLPGRGLVECINPNCIEWGFRHHIRIRLSDLIRVYLTNHT